MKTYNVCLVRKLCTCILAIVISFSNNSLAIAQNKNKLHIIFEGLDNNPDDCGISLSSIKSTAILLLRNNRIEYSYEYTRPWMYININFLKIKNINFCTFNINVKISDVKHSEIRNGFKSNKYEDILLCQKSILGYANFNTLDIKVQEGIERAIKGCLVDVNY